MYSPSQKCLAIYQYKYSVLSYLKIPGYLLVYVFSHYKYDNDYSKL